MSQHAGRRASRPTATGSALRIPSTAGGGSTTPTPELVADGELDGDQGLATDGDRPYLFGMPFDGPMLGHDAEMPIHYDLHVWLYRHNPAGRFAMWNPRVQCPDGR